ncbi:hypothetical protein [Microbacterium memoriense]|uniref:Uncharacterized protein n=1 Tax=Microbacterium memoriense TaxID=2978350 RepID=A0ABT2PEC0_9MICO|nr:hypothetical protein [Microbacterium memoriense]MCT9002946.1 hypothetical protein [Microbacterium memoriense]
MFDTTNDRDFDVLEVLTYPEGLDENGVPISVVVHPLCGAQAHASCADLVSGATGVRMPLNVVRTAIADTEYFALGGVLVPPKGQAPESFMALLKN